jgi:hypothetical protein
MDCLQSLTRLTFLHISLSRETRYRFDPEELASDMPYVSFLALGELHIWEVDRTFYGSNFPAQIRVDKWPMRRVETRVKEDFGFGGEDYEWLLRPLSCHEPKQEW